MINHAAAGRAVCEARGRIAGPIRHPARRVGARPADIARGTGDLASPSCLAKPEPDSFMREDEVNRNLQASLPLNSIRAKPLQHDHTNGAEARDSYHVQAHCARDRRRELRSAAKKRRLRLKLA